MPLIQVASPMLGSCIFIHKTRENRLPRFRADSAVSEPLIDPRQMRTYSRRFFPPGGFVRKRPTTQDAQILLQLEHLRNEPEMRTAHLWWRDRFWPRNAADYLKVEMAQGTDASRWLRQVATSWALAASLVVDETRSEKAFLNFAFSQELFTVFAKVRPFLKESRRCTDNPDFMAHVEEVILHSKSVRFNQRDRLKHR
jgi:hypothetical protein